MGKNYLLLLFVSLITLNVHSQSDSVSLAEGYKRNVIKWNMTPYLLWGSSNINISWERVLKPYRTVSVNAGYFVLPTLGTHDSLNIESARKNSGYSLAGDYRFYFKKRNTRRAPDGLYWGPYGSVHHYKTSNDFSVRTTSGTTGSLSFDGNLNIYSLGLQLGYQFVIGERFTIDLIFLGPSVSVYSLKLDLQGEIDVNEEDEYLVSVSDALISKFPFLDDFLIDREFNSKGITRSLGPGLRYMVQIGYHF